MSDALAGKRISTITYTAPDINVAEAMRDYLDSHKEFMAAKCYRDGPLKLIHYFFSEGPEYEENRSWLEGKYPKKQAEQFSIYITCTKLKKECTTIGLKFLNSCQSYLS